jgi:hypothetical protein
LEPFDIIVSSTLAMGTTYALIRIDRLRIPLHQQQRGWNAATTGTAIFSFSPFCIIAHFWVTRRSLLGIILGLLSLLFLLTTQMGLLLVYENLGFFALLAAVLLCPLPLALPLPLLFAALLATP